MFILFLVFWSLLISMYVVTIKPTQRIKKNFIWKREKKGWFLRKNK